MRRWLAVLLLAVLAAGCTEHSEEGLRVSLHRTEPLSTRETDAIPGRPALKLAVASITSPGQAVQVYTALAQHLEQQLGIPVEVVQRRTYAETYELLRSGTIDLAAVCTYVYVLGQEELGLQLLAAPEVDGKAKYQSLIIVHRDSGITSFAELRGKRFAFTDPLSTTGRLYPLSLLKEQKTAPETYFESTNFTYSHDNSIVAVLDGVVDGAAVDSLVYYDWAARHPQEAAELRVVGTSPFYGSPPLVVHPALSEERRNQLRQILLRMHETEQGAEILAQLGVDRFVVPPDAAYKDVRALADEVGVGP